MMVDNIEYVDLGLSVKWATCNLGAKTPEEFGDRYTLEEKNNIDGVKLPTKEQFEELLNNCSWKWGGKTKGCTITGKNGNSIFLPAVGEVHSNGEVSVGECGSYWSETPQGKDGKYYYYMSYLYRFEFIPFKFVLSKGIYNTSNIRKLSIRPVE